MRSLVFLCPLLLCGLLMAQENSQTELISAPEPASLAIPAAPSTALTTTTTIKTPKVIDKKFFFVMGSLAGAESLRFTTRRLVIENEYSAGAPWVTRMPAKGPMIAKDLGLFASELFVAYEMKKPHDWLPGDRIIRKLWWVYPVAMTVIHIKNGVGNIRTRGPGGCTSIECAMQMQ